MPTAATSVVATTALRQLLFGTAALATVWVTTADDAPAAVAAAAAASLAADDECAAGDEACALNALQMRGKKVAPAANSTIEMGSSSSGDCFANDQVYSLNWAAEGSTFFEKFTFVTQDDVHGAHEFATREKAKKENCISTNHGQAQMRYGGLRMPSYVGEAYKRYSVNIHSNEAWNPNPGFLAVLHYTSLPWDCGVWPSFWAMNSDYIWPKGGELDIMEFANTEPNKITFHIADQCWLDKEKAFRCAPSGHTKLHSEECETSYFQGKLGCMPPQKQPTGKMLADKPGVLAAWWTEDRIVVYHIPEAEIPADLTSDQPRPESWSKWVLAYMPFKPGCMGHVGPQELVLNLQLCGDWAGATWDSSSQCTHTGLWNGHLCVSGLSQMSDCCTKYVTSPLREIHYRYQMDWDIKSLKVYTPSGEKSQQSGTFLRDGVPLAAFMEMQGNRSFVKSAAAEHR